MSEDRKKTGGCMCGAVRYEVTGDLFWSFTSAPSTIRRRWCQPAMLFIPNAFPGLTLPIHYRVTRASSVTARRCVMAR